MHTPQLNPVENLWAQLRQGWLANRCFEGYDAIVQACCEAWNAYTTPQNAIKKLCSRKWALYTFNSYDWYKYEVYKDSGIFSTTFRVYKNEKFWKSFSQLDNAVEAINKDK